GRALEKRGTPEAAIAEYREALRLDSKSPYAHSLLGEAFQNRGDLCGAIEEHRKAVELEPTGNWHFWLIRALEAKGDKDGAVAVYRSAIRAKPADANLRHRLGTLLKEKGDLDAAIAM